MSDIPFEIPPTAQVTFINSAIRKVVDGAEQYVVKQVRLMSHASKIVSQEAMALACLNHPNIIKLYGVVEEKLRLKLEFIPGKDICALVKEDDLSYKQNRHKIFLQIARAIQHCHENNIAHRDIKPENIMITPEGKAVLIDFGFAVKTVDKCGNKVLVSDRYGTLSYASPELVDANKNNKYDPIKADIWSLGVVLYILCSGGFCPFTEAMVRKKQFIADYFPIVDRFERQLIQDMLAMNPEERPTINDVVKFCEKHFQ